MTAIKRRRGMTLLAGGLAAGMLLAACGGSDDSASDSTAEETAAEETAAEDSGGEEDAGGDMAAGCEAYADYMGNEGTTVNVFTSILPPEQQLFEEAWAQFEECTGIDIVYEASDQFEAQLPTRIAGGNAPDIAWIPQPGLLERLVADGGPVAAPASTEALVDEYWNPAWKGYGTVDGTFYAAPLGSNMKSFVWYSPQVFAENGYKSPPRGMSCGHCPIRWSPTASSRGAVVLSPAARPVGPLPTGWSRSCCGCTAATSTTSG